MHIYLKIILTILSQNATYLPSLDGYIPPTIIIAIPIKFDVRQGVSGKMLLEMSHAGRSLLVR